MGFTFQLPAIVGGTVLVIERIESQNFQPGVFGWAIYANGDAEFNNVVARGELLVGADPGQHIRIGLDSLTRPVIELSTGAVTEDDPSLIRTSPPAVTGEQFLEIIGPRHTTATGLTPQISLNSWAAGTPSQIVFSADELRTLNSPWVYENIWVGPTFLNSWVDVAGARVAYLKDAASNVHLRGQLQSGVAVTMFNLPAGYRPTQSMQFVMRSAAAAGNYSVVQVQTNGDVVVLTNFAMAQIACRLELTFSTL